MLMVECCKEERQRRNTWSWLVLVLLVFFFFSPVRQLVFILHPLQVGPAANWLQLRNHAFTMSLVEIEKPRVCLLSTEFWECEVSRKRNTGIRASLQRLAHSSPIEKWPRAMTSRLQPISL